MTITVIEHILARLYHLGITDVFGVAGDYSFPVNDAISTSSNMRWVSNCNELNAAYASDGYARIKGVAALSTTFGVGELSALNGIAGAFAERLPIFHLVGMPASKLQKSKRLSHHTLGDGDFEVFYRMSQDIVCAHAIITPENCVIETERLIAQALHERRPVYFGIPSDYALMPIIKQTIIDSSIASFQPPKSHQKSVDEATNQILHKLTNSKQSCIFAGSLALRFGLVKEVQTIIEQTGLPYTTLFMDKSIISETHPQYLGIYCGQLMNPQVTKFVENCDCILNIGTMMTDVNSACFTANIKEENIINIMNNYVTVGTYTYQHVYMQDILLTLKAILPSISNHVSNQNKVPPVRKLDKSMPSVTGKINANYLYPQLEKMFKPDDIIFADTGNFSMGLAFALLPKSATFHSQSLWGSIGWATPASFGAALAAPNRRIILATGEGAHQLTVQEISQFAFFGLKPIIFVLNNNGYLIERLLCDDPDSDYNDITQWNYAQLPAALGCDGWYCQKVTQCDELDEVLNIIDTLDTAAYIEVITDKYDSAKLMDRICKFSASLYSS